MILLVAARNTLVGCGNDLGPNGRDVHPSGVDVYRNLKSGVSQELFINAWSRRK